jgi:hypothetical protein
MEAAYKCYHRNNGNMLDLAPNGEPSVLFKTYLDMFNGDRKEAMLEKSKVYSDAFINWFGDWMNDQSNASKVVDENGEPLVVYHGGAKGIEVFKHSTEDNSTTGTGYYTDKRTGEKIPVDSANTMFFSSNPYVATSYASLYGIQYFQYLHAQVHDMLINSSIKDGLRFSRDVFKNGINDIYRFFDQASEFNPRFKKLKEYVQRL